MAGPPDRTAAAGRPAALLMRVLGTRLRYQATRKGGTNKISDLQQRELFTAQAKEAPGRGGRPHELAPGRHLSGLRGQHLVGILTERDLTAAIGQGADPATTRCRTRLPRLRRFPGPTANSPRPARVMLELGVRHLPIMGGGRLVGVLSMRDVLGADDSHER